ncbi:MAG: phosphoglucomutase, partial [Fibrobacteria bacterium]|nr:phosphoglucomutase [Fibrobacteria bacterium]
KYYPAQKALLKKLEETDDKHEKNIIKETIKSVFDLIEIQAETNEKSTQVVFGTSGWRGVIGDDYTLFNIRRVTKAIIEMYKQNVDELKDYLYINTWDEFKTRGVLIGHDTRYLGPEFAKGVACVLNTEGIRVVYAGTAITPELSACMPVFNFACSINLTPSHNPGDYGGYKFNPADGGAAGIEITSKIEEHAAKIDSVPEPSSTEPVWEKIDSFAAYTKFVESKGLIDLDFCREFAHSGKIVLAVDTVHGATRNKTRDILNQPTSLKQLRIEEEPFFGGIAPEPSEKNMESLAAYLRSQPGDLKLGAIMDPDGDRIRFHDGESDIAMNQFAVLAFHYLAVHRKREGGAAKSVPSSNFMNAVTKKLGRPLYETKVGFKNFRPYLTEGTTQPAVVAFEEADGFTAFGNTLEKDAQAGFLIALEMIGRTGKSLTTYLKDLQAEYGTYCPVRSGFTLSREMMGAPMKNTMKKILGLFKEGMKLKIGGEDREISQVITLDGLKLVFEDLSWFLIRPSGTEPKCRVYTESSTEEDANALFTAAEAIFHENSEMGAK